MKKVFSDQSQVAHLWANRIQDEATNSGRSFFFRGNTIYSYGHHFPIAKHTHTIDGQHIVLFTERGYSNTTSKHISITRAAANHLNIVYCFNPESSHEVNFKFWLQQIEQEAEKLAKARKPEIYLNHIEQIAAKVERYSKLLGAAIPVTLLEAMKITNKDEYAAYNENRAEMAKKAQKQAQAELKKKHKKALSEWLNFETNRLYVHDGSDYLRYNSENDRIETSQAVQIPNAIAKTLYNLIKTNRLAINDKVLDFNVDQIGETIKIGCHTFKKKYLLDFGSKLYQTA